MPALPFPRIDVLVIDAMGKDISGAGMDTNIIGRGVDGRPFATRRSDVGAIWVRSLTPASHGNAIGIGLADVASKSLVDSIDPDSIFVNALSSMTPGTAKTPMYFGTDRECLKAAVRFSGSDADTAGIVRIKSTLALDRFVVSETYRDEIARRSDLRIPRPPHRLRRDAADLRRRRQLRRRRIRWARPPRHTSPGHIAGCLASGGWIDGSLVSVAGLTCCSLAATIGCDRVTKHFATEVARRRTGALVPGRRGPPRVRREPRRVPRPRRLVAGVRARRRVLAGDGPRPGLSSPRCGGACRTVRAPYSDSALIRRRRLSNLVDRGRRQRRRLPQRRHRPAAHRHLQRRRRGDLRWRRVGRGLRPPRNAPREPRRARLTTTASAEACGAGPRARRPPPSDVRR